MRAGTRRDPARNRRAAEARPSARPSDPVPPPPPPSQAEDAEKIMALKGEIEVLDTTIAQFQQEA